ncbi:uncharacterized protein LOC129614554 [Condylostylus longicornis]|uniref:uncharacterized protein LOC129614554 n=1 Tax=Condylostylus longicornis TaxID=2530218 RepID=UPI00244E1F29|nr:uncharacterized protein LOC129614554 [Condylostylus longicornis]
MIFKIFLFYFFFASLNHLRIVLDIAVYARTSRNKIQLIYGGQPFIFEKILKLANGQEKKYWRCNQWWNQKCRSRVYTINDVVTPLNRYHTHEEIIKRKKRARKIKINPEIDTNSEMGVKQEVITVWQTEK